MGKRVVCYEGTRDAEADRAPIFRTKEVAERLSNGTLAIFYDQGVGINFAFLLGDSKRLGISRNIRQAYDWLAHTWQPNDKIYAFGFSRDTYTVRNLFYWLHFVGLLRPEHTDPLDKNKKNALSEEVSTAYRQPCDNESAAFQSQLSFTQTWRLKIYFLGNFDTGGLLGVPNAWVYKPLATFP